MERTITLTQWIRTAARPLVRAVRRLIAARRGCVAGAGGVSGQVRVFYGYPRLPGPGEKVVGGIVKVQGLQRLFPNSGERFNVLYLVTSRLPEEALTLARVAQRHGAKVVVNQNGVAYPGWHGPGWERVNAPMAGLLRLADHVFYQSAFCKQSADRYLGPRSAAWEILYNAVDTDAFTPPVVRREGGPLSLLLGGSQDFFYRLSTALEVLAILGRGNVDAHLTVTGRLRWAPDGAACRRAAEDLATELGVRDRVIFRGAYTQAEAPTIYQRADILLHTKYNDPCPAVVIEAIACGVPVVYSRSGGVPELVGEEAGIGVATEVSWERHVPPDPAAMADAVVEVAARRSTFAEAARRRAVERFDLRAWLDRHRAVFEALVG